MRYSQPVSTSPLNCWIICQENGEVCCAHCTCMAGLGEACTHIGAVLFYLEAVTNSSNNVTCTQQRCKWVVPTQREIPYLPIKGIDFTSAKTKHNAEALDQVQVSVSCSSNIGPPDQSEVASFFENLSKCGSKPAILSLVHPYSDNYVCSKGSTTIIS